MSQLIPIVSEALQATVRRLLPSQAGFGEDLQASNVIIPIIDLTPTAEGSILPEDLQQAINFGGSTHVQTIGTTSNIATAPGFYQVTYTSVINSASSSQRTNTLRISDGLSTKNMWVHGVFAPAATDITTVSGVLNFYLNAGETLSAVASDTGCVLHTSTRQTADVSGNLVDPVGFTAQ
jgi:hypothetical protein